MSPAVQTSIPARRSRSTTVTASISSKPSASGTSTFAIGAASCGRAGSSTVGWARRLCELRTESPEELCYEVNVPLDRKTDRWTELILKLDPDNVTSVEWKDSKAKSKK